MMKKQSQPINQSHIVIHQLSINRRHSSLSNIMSTTSNKRIKTQHHSSSNTSSDETILRHLVLDGTTERTGTTIEEGEYSESKTLETVRILQGSNISCIGDKAFYKCSSLQSIEITEGTVTTIGASTFQYCSSLQSVRMSDGVTTIGGCAFLGCSSLQTIHIPDTVTTIGWSVFVYCSSLQSIHIPNGVTTIERSTFTYCTSLQSVHMSDGVTTIGQQAFSGCSSLRYIAIPDTVTTIGGHAFTYCSKLERRQADHPNYHEDTITWLRQRFNNLPIHLACYHYGYNNTSSPSSPDNLCTLIQENKEALTTTDAMRMTPLHILCCNPHATAEMMNQIMVEAEPSLFTRTDVAGSTPLQVYLTYRNLMQVGQSIPSLQDLLEKGVKCKDLAILSVLDRNDEIDLSRQDEDTGLSPFMSAAVATGCGLDVMYTLAMRNLESLL